MDAELFWKKVKMKLSELGKNQEWLCDRAGIVLSTLRNKIHIGRMPTLDETLKILKIFKMTMEEFELYPQKPQSQDKDVINIPVYEQAFSAGKGQFVPDSAEVLEYVAVPRDLRHYSDNLRAA